MKVIQHSDTLHGDPIMGATGKFAFVTGLSAVREKIVRRIRTFKGEWFLDLDLGLDYHGNVMVKNPNLLVIESEVKSIIAGIEGFEKFLSFSLTLTPSTRTLSITFSAIFYGQPLTMEI